ncbi:MAG: polymerase beta domain protein region [Mucilaginibacter sp.]|nr:polymerase beta domain protein region [Mucilaginibacter sp.]
MERRQQILLWIKEVLDKNLSDISYHAFVFGSQANKMSLSRSDIDVGITSNDAITSLQLSNIYADIEELPMLYKIDLVNFKEVDDQFKSVALKNVEIL